MAQTSPVSDRKTAIDAAAARLTDAGRNRQPCAPVRDLLGTTDIDLAYAVQQRLTAQRIAAGAVVVGHKIGLTSAAVQRQLGVDRPDFGILFADMDASDVTTISSDRLLQPKAEAEIAFVLGADLDSVDLGIADVRAAVSYAVAALEIVDSRIRDWDITITDTIGDNASSGLFVLGADHVDLTEFEPKNAMMRLYVDGEPAAHGSGAACLGDPLAALLWLARTAREHGNPVRAGQIVLSGALGPMVAVTPGSTVGAQITGLGPVAATF